MSTSTQEKKRAPPQSAAKAAQILHTQDLLAGIKGGQVTPNGPLPEMLDRPSVRAFIRAIHTNPHKPDDQPYHFKLSDGKLIKFSLLDGADTDKVFAPPIHQLPGPGKINNWLKTGKLHLEACGKCGNKTAVIEVFVEHVEHKAGYFSIECGEVRLDFLTEDDFKPRRALPR